MNDEQYLLASAYVDGELTADERRIAEADPDVMSEVEEIHALQAELTAIEAPSDRAREAAITAAMGEFARQAAPEAPVAPVVPHRPRPAYARFVGIAAAVVAVGLLGVVVVNSGLSGGDDDDAATAPAELTGGEATAEAAESDADRMEAEVAEDGAALEATSEAPEDMAADEGLEETGEMSEGSIAAEAAPAAGGTEEPTAESTAESTSDAELYDAADPGPRPSVEPGQRITTPDELGALGTLLLELELRGELGSTPNTKCPEEFRILGETRLEEFDLDRPIYVAVQTEIGRVIALDPDDCTIVLVGPLYDVEP